MIEKCEYFPVNTQHLEKMAIKHVRIIRDIIPNQAIGKSLQQKIITFTDRWCAKYVSAHLVNNIFVNVLRKFCHLFFKIPESNMVGQDVWEKQLSQLFVKKETRVASNETFIPYYNYLINGNIGEKRKHTKRTQSPYLWSLRSYRHLCHTACQVLWSGGYGNMQYHKSGIGEIPGGRHCN